MTNPITSRRYPFSAAALASGASPKAIRNWLDKKQVLFDADEGRESGKWRRFSVWDVLRLAYARRMVDHGVPVELAGLQAGGLLVPVMMLLTYKNTPPEALAGALRGTQLLMWREPRQGWRGIVIKPGESRADITLPDSFFFMDAGQVAEDVVELLKEVDGEDDDEADA